VEQRPPEVGALAALHVDDDEGPAVHVDRSAVRADLPERDIATVRGPAGPVEAVPGRAIDDPFDALLADGELLRDQIRAAESDRAETLDRDEPSCWRAMFGLPGGRRERDDRRRTTLVPPCPTEPHDERACRGYGADADGRDAVARADHRRPEDHLGG